MHLSAFALCLAAVATPLVSAVPAVRSAAALPTYFQIKSQLVLGQSNKGIFNNLLLGYAGSLTGTEFYPAFVQQNAKSIVMQLQESIPATGSQPALSYLNWNMTVGHTFRAGLLFEELPFAGFEPTAFFSVQKPPKDYLHTAQESIVQNRFYMNQTGSGIYLEWANNKTEPSYNQWDLWLLCQSQYTFISLFFVPGNARGKVPFSCAHVNLEVIPIQP